MGPVATSGSCDEQPLALTLAPNGERRDLYGGRENRFVRNVFFRAVSFSSSVRRYYADAIKSYDGNPDGRLSECRMSGDARGTTVAA
jgi:hypothetical protein